MPSLAQKELLLFGNTAIQYLINESFNVAAGPPLSGAIAASPGPGVLTYTDGDSIFSKASGYFTAAGGGGLTGDCGFITTSYTRDNGIVVIIKDITLTTVGGQVRFGWNTSLASNLKPGLNFNSNVRFTPTGTTWSYTYGAAPDSIALMLFDTGGAAFVHVSGSWELLWRFREDATATLGGVLWFSQFGTPVLTIGDIVTAQLGTPFDSAFNMSTFTDTSLATLDTFTGTADASIDFEFTLPGSPSGGDIVGFKYRVQDATNYWYAYLKYNGGSAAWDIFLDAVEAGVATTKTTAAGVGTPDLLRIQCRGSKHDMITRASTTWTVRGSQVNYSHANASTALELNAVAGTTLTRLTSDPITSPAYANLSRL